MTSDDEARPDGRENGAILGAWPGAGARRILRRLSTRGDGPAARLWDDDPRLDQVARLDGGPSGLNLRELRFVERSLARRRQLRRGTVGTLVTLAAVLLALTAWAWIERGRALRQRDIALARQLAAQALSYRDRRLDRALLLSLASDRIAPTLDARRTLLASLVHSPELVGHLWGRSGEAYALTFGHDGKRLVSGNFDGTVTLYDVATRQPIRSPKANLSTIVAVALDPSATRVAAGAIDQTISIYDFSTAAWSTLYEGTENLHASVAFSPTDRNTLASGGCGRTVEQEEEWGGTRCVQGKIVLWDVRGGNGIPITGHRSSVVGLAFSADGKTLASADTMQIIAWDPATRRTTGGVARPPRYAAALITFTAAGRLIAAGTSGRTLISWDVASGREYGRTTAGADGNILAVAVGPDGASLASGDSEGQVILWNIAIRNRLARSLPFAARQAGLAFSRDGALLAAAGDGRVAVWELRGDRLLASFQRATSPCAALPSMRMAGVWRSPDRTAWSSGTGRRMRCGGCRTRSTPGTSRSVRMALCWRSGAGTVPYFAGTSRRCSRSPGSWRGGTPGWGAGRASGREAVAHLHLSPRSPAPSTVLRSLRTEGCSRVAVRTVPSIGGTRIRGADCLRFRTAPGSAASRSAPTAGCWRPGRWTAVSRSGTSPAGAGSAASSRRTTATEECWHSVPMGHPGMGRVGGEGETLGRRHRPAVRRDADRSLRS